MQSRRVRTAEILAARALGCSCGQECVDWAVTMLVEGRDTARLRMLAGKDGPHDHIEIARLRDQALDELGEMPVSHGEAVRLFARERLRAALQGDADLATEIEAVAQLCIEHDYAPDVYDFYLLHYAYEFLRTSEVVECWPDADRSNILQIMKQRAEEFVREDMHDSNG